MSAPVDARRASERVTRAEIQDVATHLFYDLGFDASPVNAIAEDVGCPRHVVHTLGGTKVDLLFAVIRNFERESVDLLRDLQTHGDRRLERYVASQVEHRLLNIAAATVAGRELRHLDAERRNGIVLLRAEHDAFVRSELEARLLGIDGDALTALADCVLLSLRSVQDQSTGRMDRRVHGLGRALPSFLLGAVEQAGAQLLRGSRGTR